MSAETLSPNPTSTAIKELTDQTFDRVQKHLELYANDTRRINDGGHLILDPETLSNMHAPDMHYGRLVLKVCNKKAEQQAYSTFLGSAVCKTHLPAKRFLDSGGNFFRDPAVWEPQLVRFKIIAERDYYPEGNTQYGLFAGSNEDVWGERHSIGVGWTGIFKHSKLPLYEQYDAEVVVRTRFDKPEPQIASDLKTTVAVNQGDATERYHSKSDNFALKRMTMLGSEVEQIASILELTKDVRPAIAPIDKIIESNRAWSGLINNFLNELGRGDRT